MLTLQEIYGKTPLEVVDPAICKVQNSQVQEGLIRLEFFLYCLVFKLIDYLRIAQY